MRTEEEVKEEAKKTRYERRKKEPTYTQAFLEGYDVALRWVQGKTESIFQGRQEGGITEKQPECCVPDCPMVKDYGDKKIREGWEYLYCPEGGEVYCLMEQGEGRPLGNFPHICPTHHVRVKSRHYPKSFWDE